ncbi:MAG: hypothetical protein WBF53_12540, partial [Litorimonas sp.]
MNAYPNWGLTALLMAAIGLGGCNQRADTDSAASQPIATAELDVDVVQRGTNTEPDATAELPQQVFVQDGAVSPLRYRGLSTGFDNGSPTACLRFSAELDPDTVIEDRAFVRVEPETPISLSVDGRSLCVLGLDDGVAEQTVTVRAGFAGADGSELAADIVETVTFDPKPALVGFVGDGIILPRNEGSVLGIKAMNADAVQLTVYRVNHRALFDQSPEIGETTPEGDWSWNSAAWSTRVEVLTDTIRTAGDVNEMVEVGYPLGDLVEANGPGAYIVEVRRDAPDDARQVANSWRWLYVTDLALATYRTSEALDVTVRSIATAATVPDVKLTLIARNNDVLAEARADANGRARFPGAALR